MIEPKFYTIDQLSIILGSQPKTIRNQLYAYPETLPPSTKVGGRRLFKRVTVDTWFEQLPESKSF